MKNCNQKLYNAVDDLFFEFILLVVSKHLVKPMANETFWHRKIQHPNFIQSKNINTVISQFTDTHISNQINLYTNKLM